MPRSSLTGFRPLSRNLTEALIALHLPHAPNNHGVAIFPGANHGMFIADPDAVIPRRDQLAPGYPLTLSAFLADRRVPTMVPTPLPKSGKVIHP